MNIERSLERAIEVSVELVTAIAAWFKLLTTTPAASSPTQGATSFSRASSGTAVDANGLLVSYAANVPRQQDGGLLIEQSSTNLCVYSEQVDNAAWNKAGALITADTIASPDNAATADELKEATFGAQHRAFQVVPITNGVTYTLSAFVKRGSGTRNAQLGISSGGIGARTYFDLGAGTVANASTGTGTIKSIGNGWFRITATGIVNGTTATLFLANTIGTTTGAESYTGDGTSSLYWWGAQLETGSKATSYIKTLNAPVTRAADVCYTATANIPTLANGATFVWKGALPDDGDGLTHAAFRSTPYHTILWRSSNGSVVTYIGSIYMGGVSGIDAAVHTYAVRTNGSNLHELLIDGVVVLTSTKTGLMQPITPIYIGSTTGTAHFLNDSMQSFTMYDTALTDAELQGLG